MQCLPLRLKSRWLLFSALSGKAGAPATHHIGNSRVAVGRLELSSPVLAGWDLQSAILDSSGLLQCGNSGDIIPFVYSVSLLGLSVRAGTLRVLRIPLARREDAEGLVCGQCRELFNPRFTH